MKMRSTANSDEPITSNRSTRIVSYNGHPSQRRKEQISGSKNAQTKYGTHLSQNDAHSSTYESDFTVTLADRHVAIREQHVNPMAEDQRSVPKSSNSKIEQNHKAIDTRDGESPRRYESETTTEEDGIKPHLWCARYREKKKKCRKLDLRKSTGRLLERIKKRSKVQEKPDDTMVDVSSAPHRESISRRSTVEKKSKRSPKQDATADKDDVEKIKSDKGKRKEKEKEKEEKEKEEEEKQQKRQQRKKERREMREKREKLKHDETIPPPVDAYSGVATSYMKTCCYLCAQNTLAIAAASGFKAEQSNKCIQVPAHKFHTETPMFDKGCSAILLVRTVQSSVKVKTRETSTLCPGTSARRKETKPRTKRKKLSVFPRLTWTKCPARRHVACETDKSAWRDNVEKREPRNEKCCREKNV